MRRVKLLTHCCTQHTGISGFTTKDLCNMDSFISTKAVDMFLGMLFYVRFLTEACQKSKLELLHGDGN